MNFNIDPVPLFDYKNGDQVTALDVNNVAIKVFNKYNFLNPNNVRPLNSGFFYDESNYMLYPNYCGWLSIGSSSTARGVEFDELTDLLIDDINDIIKTYTGG